MDYNLEENIQTEVLSQEPVVDIKKERKWCSGIGFNYLLFTLLAIGGQYGMMFLIAYVFPQVMFNTQLYIILLMLPIYVLGVPVLAATMKASREKTEIEKHSMKVGHFLIAITICFALMIGGNIIGLIITGIIGFIKGSPVVNSLSQLLGGLDLWTTAFLTMICAPIFEELIFRKFLIDRMIKYGEGVAIAVSGIMFGLFHGNLSQFFYATFLGAFFAFIYAKTGKIWYTMLLHLIINFFGGVASMIMMNIVGVDFFTKLQDTNQVMDMIHNGDVTEWLTPLMVFAVYAFIMYGMAVLGAIFLALRHKKFTLKPGKVTIPKGKRASVVWGNAGMILFTLANCVMIVMSLMV